MQLTTEQQRTLQEISRKYEDLENLVPALKTEAQPAYFQLLLDEHSASNTQAMKSRSRSRQEVFRQSQERKSKLN